MNIKKNYFEYIDNFDKTKEINSKKIICDSNRKNVKFTIAIPTFRRPKLLKKALESAINQEKISNYEIVIVDNDINDKETKKTVEMFRNENVDLYYFKNKKNIGMFNNWNRCIKLANGEYITILNDDDWLNSNFLYECSKILNNNDIDGLYFKNKFYDFTKGEGCNDQNQFNLVKKIFNILSKKKKKLTLFDFFLGNKSPGTLGVLMKTEYLKKLGGYNPNYYPSSDYILHANYCYNYKVYMINKEMSYYRIFENESLNKNTLKKWVKTDKKIREYFIKKLNYNENFLLYLNNLMQDKRITELKKKWGYDSDYEYNNKLLSTFFQKLITLKYYMNI